MQFAVLSSGSRANCTYLETSRTRILIDCGLSAALAERGLFELGREMKDIDAILVTHEHRDHLYGVPTLSRRYRVPVYVNRGAKPFLGPVFGTELFQTGIPFCVGDLQVLPIPLPHDASDPVGFVVTCQGLKFSHVTDLGWVTPQVREALTLCHAFVLESNHDEEMLSACRYPWELKERIRSNVGHLSNIEAARLVRDVQHSDLRHVVLGHLSENSNNHTVALSTHHSVLGELSQQWEFSLRCASVRCSTDMICIDDRPHAQQSLFQGGAAFF